MSPTRDTYCEGSTFSSQCWQAAMLYSELISSSLQIDDGQLVNSLWDLLSNPRLTIKYS